MIITIVGGGNIGTQFAVHCAEKGHEVIVYTSSPDLFDSCLNIVNENGDIIHKGVIRFATSDPQMAFSGVDLIIVTTPATVMKSISKVIFENSDNKPMICVVPGYGGSECVFRKCIERGNGFFGLERVPAIARLVQKGKSVRSIGYRNMLHVAALPRKNAEVCAKLIKDIFDTETQVIPDYLNFTLTPSNPILHTTRLKSLFGEWHEGTVLRSVPLFYEEWDNHSSELLIACDKEVQEICRSLTEFDLQYVIPLTTYYESSTARAMTNKISSIPAFRGLTSPVVEVEGGFVPDLHSRYFTSDFSYGLAIIKQVADFADVRTPNIDGTLNWYNDLAVEKEAFRFEDYGINSKKEFIDYYKM